MAAPSRRLPRSYPGIDDDLKARRRVLADSMEAVLQRSRDENRDMTAMEAGTFDGLLAEAKELDRLETETETPSRSELTMNRSGLAVVRAPAVHTRVANLPGGEQRWNFGAALALVLEERDPGVDTGFEVECHQEMVNRGIAPRHGGMMMPMNGLLTRAPDIGTKPGDPAASLVGIDFRFDLFGLDVSAMRARLIAGRVGAMVLTSQEPAVVIPRQDAPLPDAVWLARDAAITTQADLNTRAITLTPHTLAARHLILRSARLYGTPSIYGLYQQQIVQKMNYAVDRAWLYGDSTVDANSPDGLIRQPRLQRFIMGVGGATPAPALPTYPSLVNMLSLVATQPAEGPRPAWLMSPLLELTMMGLWKTLIDPAAGPPPTSTWFMQSIIPDGGSTVLLNKIYQVGKQIPVRGGAGGDNTTDLWYCDDWSSTGVCYFNSGAVEVLPNPYGAAYGSGGIELITFQDADCFAMDAVRAVLSQDVLIIQPTPPAIPLSPEPTKPTGRK
jgi:hypothetical protein